MRRLPLTLPLLSLLVVQGSSSARSLLTLPLRIRVASCDGRPVRPESWLRAHIAAAQKVLGPQGVRLQPSLESFEPTSCEALDRAGRDAWARDVPEDGVTVLVVERVRDLGLASYDLMGVHWHYRGSDASLKGRRYVLLTARARPPVLAHELAHYLGLPHDPAGGNLMTPGPSDPIWRRPEATRPEPFAPLLTAAQGRRLRAAVQELLTSRVRSGPPAGR